MGIKDLSEKHLTEDQLLSNNISFETKIELAVNIANMLSPLLEQRNLVVQMRSNGKTKGYVTAEGWNTLGTLLGLSPVTEYVRKFHESNAKTAYVAKVSIMKGSQVISSAEAIATSGGFQKTEHAIYSMAQTRAMGKAYRMCLSWIMTLSGYEATPAEEMQEVKKEGGL